MCCLSVDFKRQTEKSAADFINHIQFVISLSQANIIQQKDLCCIVKTQRQRCYQSYRFRITSLPVLAGNYLHSTVPLNFQLHGQGTATLISANSAQHMAS